MSNSTNSGVSGRLKQGFKMPHTQNKNLNDTETSTTSSTSSTSSRHKTNSTESATKNRNLVTPKIDSKTASSQANQATSNSLKSSVKRLFSPGSTTKGAAANNNNNSVSTKKNGKGTTAKG